MGSLRYFIAASIVGASLTFGSTPVVAQSDAPMEEVVVTGEHEGPRLWKVTKGDHVLWILGTVTPLPKKMVWQSDPIEAVLQQSQEVVPSWPALGIGYGELVEVGLASQPRSEFAWHVWVYHDAGSSSGRVGLVIGRVQQRVDPSPGAFRV